MKNWTASKHFGPRGYLVTTDNKPANYEYLAAQLEQMNVEELKQAMPLLEDIGLIERVSMNGSFKPDGPVRSKPDSSGRKRKALKKDKDKNKNKSNTKSKNKNKFGNGNTKRKKNTNRQKRGKDNSKSLKGQSKREDKATTATPATTPPIVPQIADARGSRIISFNPAPSGPVEQGGPQRIGQIVQGMVHRYDDDAKRFGGEVYQALAIGFSPDSAQGRRELGCFASMWTKAKSAGIGADALEELRSRAIKEACKIAKRKRKCGNVSAVWCTVFKRLLAARCSEARCKVM